MKILKSALLSMLCTLAYVILSNIMLNYSNANTILYTHNRIITAVVAIVSFSTSLIMLELKTLKDEIKEKNN